MSWRPVGLAVAVAVAGQLAAAGASGFLLAPAEERGAMSLKLDSPAFREGEMIPGKHTCEGTDRSPQLRWTDPPTGTKSFALIVDDPDAPRGTWVHWVLYGLAAETRELPEGMPPAETVAGGARQGRNDFGRLGYGGPCPPPGPPHRYFFKLYALDAPPTLGPGATKAELLKEIEKHVLAEAVLMGRYARRSR